MHRNTRPAPRTYPPQVRPRALAGLVALCLLVACGQQQDTGAGTYNIDLLPPEAAANRLSVRLTDDAGLPITGAQVSLEGNMYHAGMAPVLAGPVADADDGSADGVYRVPFEFTMFGDWIVTASVRGPAFAETVARDFRLSVDGDGATLTEP